MARCARVRMCMWQHRGLPPPCSLAWCPSSGHSLLEGFEDCCLRLWDVRAPGPAVSAFGVGTTRAVFCGHCVFVGGVVVVAVVVVVVVVVVVLVVVGKERGKYQGGGEHFLLGTEG
jgi:hypothetical protein